MSARRPIDDQRKAIFLSVLAATGSMSAAAAAATPHSDGGKENRAGYRSFLDEMRRNPAFAQAVEEAKQHALGLVEETIARRAMTPEKQPIFQRGELVGYRESYRDANQLLLRMAERSVRPGRRRRTSRARSSTITTWASCWPRCEPSTSSYSRRSGGRRSSSRSR